MHIIIRGNVWRNRDKIPLFHPFQLHTKFARSDAVLDACYRALSA